WQQESYWPTF
nr:immunoglobulin light chain junction region [Macaca mulatta]